MDGKQTELAHHADICTVCEKPIDSIAHPLTAEYLGKAFSFCSQGCYQRYLDDPAQFASFEGDEELE